MSKTNKFKVVINRCYGGFGLSKAALKWLKKRGFKHIDDDGSGGTLYRSSTTKPA